MNLYLTADTVGGWTGGSQVTFHESEALKGLGPCEVWDRTFLEKISGGTLPEAEPWGWDGAALGRITERSLPDNYHGRLNLCHGYAGTFSHSIRALQDCGVKVSWTVAAHDREKSRRAHEDLGIPFDYPHLVRPDLWRRYSEGYRLADLNICPSEAAAAYQRGIGCKNVVVIPHGCRLPRQAAPFPGRFVAGYLGSFGADKGVRHLLEAWKMLDFRDGTLLLAGKDSSSPWARHLINRYGGGNIQVAGWVDDPGDFYNKISLYVQPSVTEGFGMEVLEAMAHSRPVVCSEGAGAVDIVTPDAGARVPAGDADALAGEIERMRSGGPQGLLDAGRAGRREAEKYSWDEIRGRYKRAWSELLK